MEGSYVMHGIRPVPVVSNDAADKYSPLVTVIPLTSRLSKAHLPTHVILRGAGLRQDSLTLCEQVLTRDKHSLVHCVGCISNKLDQLSIQHALAIQLNMADYLRQNN